MRILQITNRIPFPPKDGGSIGYYNFTKSYSDTGCELTLLAMNTAKHFVEPSSLPDYFCKFADIHSVYVDNRIKPLDALFNLFTNKSYNIQRFENKAFENKLITLLNKKEFDIIHLDSLFVGTYIATIRKHSKATIVLRAHNVEHLIWQRIADVEKNPIKRAYLKLLASRLKAFEQKAINEVDLVLPISDFDKQTLTELGCKTPQYVVTAGIDTQKFICDHANVEYPSLFHLGSLDWIPNQQAIIWFIDNVWPLVHQKHPDLKFYLAGRNMPEWIKNIKQPNLIIVGEVDDAVAFINSKAIMIVPLLSGSGMRLKIIEGLALGKTIIATTIGAEGIEYTNNKDIIIADTPDEFVASIDKCIHNPEFYLSIGTNASILAENKYNNHNIVERLVKYYKTIS